MILSMTSCKSQTNKTVEVYGVSPHTFSQSEKDLLEILHMQQYVEIITMYIPMNVLSVKVKCYYLDNGKWMDNGEGEVIRADGSAGDISNTKLNLIYKKNGIIEFPMSSNGSTAEYVTRKKHNNSKDASFTKATLKDKQDIALNKEIPVAIAMSTPEDSVRVLSVDDYYKPERFSNKAFVQAVTVTFSDKDVD